MPEPVPIPLPEFLIYDNYFLIGFYNLFGQGHGHGCGHEAILNKVKVDMSSQLENIDFIKFLLAQPPMQRVTENDLMELFPYLQVHAYTTGTTVFDEGEPSDSLSFIFDGNVVLVKQEKDREYLIGQLGKGEVIGEMGFITNSPRSCSIKANSDLVLISLQHEGWEHGSDRIKEVYNKIVLNLSSIIISRLKSTNSMIAKNRKLEVQKANTQNELIQFFLFMITSVLLTSGGIVLFYFTSDLVYFPLARWFGILALFLLVYGYIRYYNYHLSKFGLSLANWHNALGRGLAWSAFATASLALFITGKKLLGIQPHLTEVIETPFSGAFAFIYPLYAFLSEFILRGVLQGSLVKILMPKPGWISVFFIAILVASCNLPFGFATALFVFGLNLACGFLYLSDENLLTVTILHLCIVAILSLDLQYFYSNLS